MAAGLRLRDGNLVLYPLDNAIGVVDALRDGLISGEMKIEDPLAHAILGARVRAKTAHEAPPAATAGRDLAFGFASFRAALSLAEDQAGLDAREEQLELGSIGYSHHAARRITPGRPRTFTTWWAKRGAALRYEPSPSLHGHPATHALAAVSDL